MGFDDIPEQALAWVNAGVSVALATVVQTWGSAPRPVGAMLAITADGYMVGSVSGGCVEGSVVEAAVDALQDGQCQILEYGVSDEDTFAVGLACGGTIRILLEPVGMGNGPSVDLLKELVAARAARQTVAYRVNTSTWDRSLTVEQAEVDTGFDGDWFVNIHNPPLRLIVVGAVHIAQPLLQIAKLAGYDTTLVDPRTAFASSKRFPVENLVHDWPDIALENADIDGRTAIVTLAHDPKIDDPAITAALKSQAFYVGSLGSKRTHAKRVSRLIAAGLDETDVARIHAPVGADIGAKTPSEIAISIMAEITERLRRPKTRR